MKLYVIDEVCYKQVLELCDKLEQPEKYVEEIEPGSSYYPYMAGSCKSVLDLIKSVAVEFPDKEFSTKVFCKDCKYFHEWKDLRTWGKCIKHEKLSQELESCYDASRRF